MTSPTASTLSTPPDAEGAGAVLDGRFTSGKLRGVLAETCALLGLDPAGARLLRFTNNAVYALVTAPFVIRIVGSTRLRHRVGTVVRVARHFERHGVPAIRLLGDVEQPLEVGGHLVTVWHQVPSIGRAATSSLGYTPC